MPTLQPDLRTMRPSIGSSTLQDIEAGMGFANKFDERTQAIQKNREAEIDRQENEWIKQQIPNHTDVFGNIDFHRLAKTISSVNSLKANKFLKEIQDAQGTAISGTRQQEAQGVFDEQLTENLPQEDINKYYGEYDPGLAAMVKPDIKASGSGSGLTGWKEKIKERDAITSGISPYTGAAIKTEDELNDAWDMWEKTWATTPALAITPKYIKGAAKRAGATGYSSRRGSIGAEQDVGGVNPVIANRTSKMRNEFINLPEVKTAKTISQNYKKAKQAYADYKAGKTSAYNVDQSLGYFASKALDPNSVVMPGEFDRFAKGLGVVEGAEAMVKKLISGGLKLTDAQREAMMQIVDNANIQAINAANEQYAEYNRLSKQYNLAPDDVTGSMRYIVGGTGKKKTLDEIFK